MSNNVNAIDRISDYSALESLIRDYKQNNDDLINNLPFDRRIFSSYIDEDRLYLIENDNGICILADDINYYLLYYLLDRNNNIPVINPMDRTILLNEYYVEKYLKDDMDYEKCIFDDSGFIVESKNYQLEINLKDKENEIKSRCEDYRLMLKEYGYDVEDIVDEYNEEISLLWKDNLKITDIPYEHYYNGNNICIKDDGKIVACAWYRNSRTVSEWRHVVVDERYRGKKLASALLYLWMNRLIEENIYRGFTWVEKDNEISLSLHKKMGFVTNGRISIQYILKK